MSIRTMQRVYDSNVEPALRFITVTLAWFADDQGQHVYPSVPLLARMLGCTERHVREQLAELRKLGVITLMSPSRIVTREGEVVRVPVGGRNRPACYQLNLEGLSPKPCTTVQGLVPAETLKSATKTLKSATETLKSDAQNPEAQFTRSVGSVGSVGSGDPAARARLTGAAPRRLAPTRAHGQRDTPVDHAAARKPYADCEHVPRCPTREACFERWRREPPDPKTLAQFNAKLRQAIARLR